MNVMVTVISFFLWFSCSKFYLQSFISLSPKFDGGRAGVDSK